MLDLQFPAEFGFSSQTIGPEVTLGSQILRAATLRPADRWWVTMTPEGWASRRLGATHRGDEAMVILSNDSLTTYDGAGSVKLARQRVNGEWMEISPHISRIAMSNLYAAVSNGKAQLQGFIQCGERECAKIVQTKKIAVDGEYYRSLLDPAIENVERETTFVDSESGLPLRVEVTINDKLVYQLVLDIP